MSSNNHQSSALASLAAAEDELKKTDQKSLKMLQKLVKPPMACITIFEGIGLLLEPSKMGREWSDDQRLLNDTNGSLVERLIKFDKDSVTDEQLERLQKILSLDNCQPDAMKKASAGCYSLLLWLKAIVEYSTERRQAH